MVDAILHGAATTIAQAEALMIGAGAGMGVDSGLPDFRGADGFWCAYPPYARLGLRFVDVANPRWFRSDPTLAWGFYGHRMGLYRRTMPHQGFAILSAARADRMAAGSFVYTSNVDSHFQHAGFDADRIVEAHGSLGWMQCTGDCGIDPYDSDPYRVEIDEATMRALDPLPECPNCGALARPNVLMFGDRDWTGTRSDGQHQRFERWLETLAGRRVVIVECGAGTAIPTIRLMCEAVARYASGTLIRINPREPDVPSGQIAIPAAALATLEAIDRLISSSAIR